MEALGSHAGIPSLVPVLKDRWIHVSRAALMWGRSQKS